jgi:hypothetical protein
MKDPEDKTQRNFRIFDTIFFLLIILLIIFVTAGILSEIGWFGY